MSYSQEAGQADLVYSLYIIEYTVYYFEKRLTSMSRFSNVLATVICY